MTILFGVFLLTLLVITAVAIVRAQHLFVAVILTGVFSLLMAANFFLLDAADVALTEAAIGAGISTVLFLGALALTGEHERTNHTNRILALGVVGVVALLVIYATFDKPRFGDPEAPVHQHVAPWYIEQTPKLIDIPNVVTAVLGSFRAYDTIGEVFVVFTAGIGVMFLLGSSSGSGSRRKTGTASNSADGVGDGLRHYLVPRMVGRMLIPFILLFGLYVQFHGDYGPGGGFQAGALIAASIILYALLEGEAEALRVIPRGVLNGLVAGGGLLYGAVGVAGILMGGNFLDYSVLADDPVVGQHLGLLLIEAGVGITVTGVLLSVFHAFAGRGRA
jgi:multicomponent Na+:H+ antiporter subunit B